MDLFLLNKYQTVEENIVVTSKILYELLDNQKHVDQLFLDFANARKISLNLNIERILYLALTFLYSMGIVVSENNAIRRAN
jgi:hypothetical protein